MAEPTSTRDRILTAAVACMREHGVRGTTTKLVSREAGVAEGSIYNHFANRTDLIVAAFMAATDGVRDMAGALPEAAGTGSVEDNVVDVLTEVIPFFRRIAPIAGAVIGDPELRSWFADGRLTTGDGAPLSPLTGVVGLGSYLERERAGGRIAADLNWPVVASMLIGSCLHYVFLEQLSTGAAPGSSATLLPEPREFARQVVRTALRGD